MFNILDSFRKYSSNIQIETERETFESYTLIFTMTDLLEPLNWSDFQTILSLLNSRDNVRLDITLDGGEPFSFQKSDLIEFNQTKQLNSINSNIEDDSEIKIKYEVTKLAKNQTISIYNFSLFNKYLASQPLKVLLNILHTKLLLENINILEIQLVTESKIYFKSSLMLCSTINHQQYSDNLINNETRNKTLETRRFNTNPQGLSDYKFVPEDFSNEVNISEPNDFDIIMEKLKVVFAASFLANASDLIDSESVFLGFIGHKFLNIECDFKSTNFGSANVFFNIYKWVYGYDDIHDKLDLSRNIISRYLMFDNSKLILPKDTLNSVQSAHAIYLKENVEKYIETKNKVAEVSTELSIKSRELSQYFISSFKNNNLVVLSFFTSLMVFNTMSDDLKNSLFSGERYYLSLVFLFISTVYLLISRSQIKKDLILNLKYFYSMKRIYKDLFDKKELKELFNSKHLRENNKYVLSTVNKFSYFWLTEIIVLLILIVCLNIYKF